MKLKQLATVSLLMLAVSMCLISCRNKGNETITPTPTAVPTLTNGINEISPTLLVSENTVELQIYSIHPGTGEILPATALFFADTVTPEVIVENVIESMEDASYFIEIESVTTEDKTVIVSFSSDTPPSTGVSEECETNILDAFAQSLLDNLKDYSKVVYRIEGEAYKSNYKNFTSNYVYLENKN